MAFTVVELKNKGGFEGGVGYVPRPDITRSFPAPEDSGKLESRNSIKGDVVLSLKDPNVSKIGVYGISGVGKTTLVKEIAKQVKDVEMFDVVVMVTDVAQKNLERIQEEIAEQLGLHALKEMTSSMGRAHCLCERIKKERTILIILDDLWEKIDLERLGIPSLDAWGKMNSEKVGVPLKDDCKGCKLLFTSRTQGILQKNDTQKNFSLHVLNDEESWRLLEAVGDVKDDDFRNTATQVAQRCAGLPVLIVTIAKSLKHNDNIYYWKDTLNNLNRVDNRDLRGTLFSALEFNLNRLEDEVKKVFMLCGVFGKSLWVSDLLKYVIGLGVFKFTSTIEDARNRLHRIIDDLKGSCFLVDDDARVEMIQMHDSFREVAISIASKDVFTKSNAMWQDWPREDIPKMCTHIILNRCCIQKLPEKLDCPHLTFLYINSFNDRTLRIPNSFFEGTGKLEVLDLTGLIMSSLPSSLSSLTKLKTLSLDLCCLTDMTGIGTLISLETLSLIHSSMEEFPSEIEKLTKLRMLDLSESGIKTTLPNILCKLTKIEELYMGDARITWEVESSTKKKRNASLPQLGHLAGLTTLEIQIPEAWLLPKDIPFDQLERYKVVTGDEWEWSGNKETSRLLKIKLDTDILLKSQGIKASIKRVEDLYLDKIGGISNVLFELNGEGFPLLKHLHIQNNSEIQHIINSMERNQNHVLFPELETMVLHNLNSLVKICHGPIRGNSFAKLKVFKVKNCDQLVHLFSASMVKAFSDLVEIEVSECSSMKKIVSIESADGDKTIDDMIEFPSLRLLTLQHLPTIDDFCSHELMSSRTTQTSSRVPTPFFSAKVKFFNLETLKLNSVNLNKIWDDNQSSVTYLIQNLAKLTIENCSGLKYLFSSSMMGKLLNLKQLEISNCDMIEEIIASEEINDIALEEVIFPKLEAIIIKDMHNLKTMWHPNLASNSLVCFKTLKVKNCKKIEKIFPEYMNGAFATLETLKVKDCESVQEIFQLGGNEDDTTQLKYITLLRLPQLKQIWGRNSQSSLGFKNLQVVRVENCEVVEYIFPFSLAKHLPELEEITIKNVTKMKEIVSQREEPLDNAFKFKFDKLTSMTLWELQDLQGFCVGNHSLYCSSLKELDVWNCVKLKLFKAKGTSSRGRLSDDPLYTSMQRPLFTIEEVIENLEFLSLNNEDARMICQSQVSGDQFHRLNTLRLSELEDAQVTSPYWFLQNISSLEWLVIQDNYFEEIFLDERGRDESGEIEIKTRLKKLTLYKLHELQHICNEGRKLEPVLEVLEYLDVDECPNLKHLVPSSVAFNHLINLEVQNCSGLIYLMTSSTARGLIKLKILKIRECDLVEKIVTEEGGESNNETEFNNLQILELESLSKLHCFGSSNCYLKLPLLEKLVIRQCPRMKTFSMSGTSAPLLGEILTDEQDQKWFCEGDLNSTVNKMFQHMVAVRSWEHLQLSQYTEFKDMWYNHNVQHGVFGKLKTLAVHDCDFLSDVLLPLNLLQGLPNLEELDVIECDSLEGVFDLSNMNETESIHLKKISLVRLPCLKHIWKLNSHQIVSCDDSQGLKIPKLQDSRETTKQVQGDLLHQQQAYLMGQVLLPKLETLIIEGMENLETIWHPVLTPNSMVCFKTLKVTVCEKIEHIFPTYMHGAFATLETLNVHDCNSVQEIFQLGVNEIQSEDDATVRLRNITLSQLPKLKQIWSRDPQSSLFFKNLQDIRVQFCGALEYLFPFSIAKLLPELEAITVKNAEKMKEIVSMREEPLDDAVKFEFNQLNSMVLWDLQDLQGFYAGNHSLSCSSLKKLDVWSCLKLKLLKTQGTSQRRLSDDNLQQMVKFPSLEHMVLSHYPEFKDVWYSHDVQLGVFGKLKILKVQHCEILSDVLLSFNLLQGLPNLEEVHVRGCDSLEAVFDLTNMNEKENITRLKNITLIQLPKLKQIWSRDPQSSLDFKNLQVVRVEDCGELKYLFPFSIAKRLPQLEAITVRNAEKMKEIVSMREEPLDDVAKFEFNQLNSMVLWNLQDLQIFYAGNHSLSCSSLKELDVNNCKILKLFKTQGTSSQGRLSVDNLQHMVAIPGLEHLVLSQFGNLKILKVQGCDFLSDVLLPLNLLQGLPNLEEVDVKECHSLEAVFDLTNMNGNEALVRETIQLKRITLFRLPKLKHVWKQNFQEIISFQETTEEDRQPAYSFPQVVLPNLETITIRAMQNLETIWHPAICPKSMCNFKTLEIYHCGKLENICPLYMQEASTSLETLTVMDCGSVKEIFQLGIREEEDTAQLKNITLLRLPQLQKVWSIDPQKSLRFCNMEVVWVEECTALEYIFPFSIAMGLLKLEQVKIRNAWNMKEIVSGKEVFLECPPKFTFNRLCSLEIWCSPELQGKSYDPPIILGNNLSHHTTNSVMAENRAHPSQASKATTSSSTTPVAEVVPAIGTQEIHHTKDKSMIRTDEDAEKLATTQNTEESCDTFVEAQKICEAIKKPSIPAAQNVPNAAMIHEAAIDSSPSQTPEPMISSIEKSNIYRDYKGMVDIPEQNMPHLEAGVKHHPQMLDWLNTKQPRVFASSSFSLFAEVTRILRTTRRGHLTEDNRNYIRECCTILKVIGFDASWLSYVYKCIEECGDGEDIKSKVEEAKVQASNLKAQLESIKKELACAEKSLELLLDNSLELLHDNSTRPVG